MSQKTFSLTAGVLFMLIALGHALRLAFGRWDITVAGQPIPSWPSGVALVITGYLAYEGFRLGRKSG